MGDLTARLLVLGGGPGGYTAAVRAGQLGVDTVLVEQGSLGGTCLNVGCIPSKALVHVAAEYARAAEAAEASPFGLRAGPPSLDFAQAMAWKDGVVARLNAGVATLLKGAGVRTVQGRGVMLDGKTCRVQTDTGPQTIRAEHVLLATGSEAVELPALPFGGRVVCSTGALSLPEVPARLAVVGAGYIGLELGMAFARLGAQVTVLEAADRILPGWDADLTRPVLRAMEGLGMEVLTGTEARGLAPDGAGLRAAADGAEWTIPADVILVAAGRRPCTQGFGLEALDLAMDGPFLRVDARCAASMRNVWAVGDVTGVQLFTHVADYQARIAEHNAMSGLPRRRADYRVVPWVTFTDPELARVGLTEPEARAAGYDVKCAVVKMRDMARAITAGETDGMVKLVADRATGQLLGGHILAARAGELLPEVALTMRLRLPVSAIAETIHAYPTLSEAVFWAAFELAKPDDPAIHVSHVDHWGGDGREAIVAATTAG